MNKTAKTIIGIIIIVIIVILVVIFSGEKGEKEPIKIGFLAPLTGDAASYGQGEKNAVDMAVEKINAEGGIKGRLLEVVYEDGKCSGKEATTAAQKLINIDKVKIILGGACSGETLAVAPIAEENKVILFSAFSSHSDITEAGDFIFRNSTIDSDAAMQIAEMIFKEGYKKVAIISENTDYCQGVREMFREYFKRLGGEVVADELYGMESKDYRTQLTKIKNTNPDAIFFNPQSGIAAGLTVKQAKELNIEVPYFGNYAFSSGDALTNGGSALDGLKFVDAPGLSKDNPKAVQFLNEYVDKYSKPSSDYEIGARYDSVFIIANSLKDCGENTECIKDYLYETEYDGTIGKYGFDENGDVVGIKFAIKKIKNGQVTLIKQPKKE